MFAVPGWSVASSALKSQTEQAPPAQNESQAGKDGPTNAKNKKRKRGNDRVTAGNVDDMYRRHIEKAPRKPANDKKRKDDKQAPATSSPKATGEANAEAEAAAVKPTEDETAQDEGKQTKKQKKNKKKNKDNENQGDNKDAATAPSKETAAASDSLAPPPATAATLTPLQQAMRQKLVSSRFRHLNETLYTTDSSKAVELFNANPELFDEYHAGFSRQVKESWPSNPVDGYIQTVRRRAAVPVPKRGQKPQANRALPMPRRPNGACTVVDLGCGDGLLARTLTPSKRRLNLRLNSYDLQSPDPLITKADISNLPMEDGSADVAIFCLSLMGTNWVSFVEEAWRVLRGDGKGECWVSEVKSRFGKVTRKKAQIGAVKPLSKADQKKQKKKGGNESDLDEEDIYAEDARPANHNDDTDISAFVEVFRSRGFVLREGSVDKSNKMFVKMEFVKGGGAPTKGKHATGLSAPAPGTKKRFVDRKPENGMTPEQEAQVLKPCVYKIR
jgi:ribosomal RNA-processing protein 8